MLDGLDDWVRKASLTGTMMVGGLILRLMVRPPLNRIEVIKHVLIATVVAIFLAEPVARIIASQTTVETETATGLICFVAGYFGRELIDFVSDQVKLRLGGGKQ